MPDANTPRLHEDGKIPDGWEDEPNMKCQMDEDASWSKKHDKSYYGNKNHSNSEKVQACSVRRSRACEEKLRDQGYMGLIHRKDAKQRTLNQQQQKTAIGARR